MDMSSAFFLDALCLAVYHSKSDDTKVLLTTAVDIFKLGVRENNALFDDPKSRLYVMIIESILKGNLNLEVPGEVTAFLMRLETHPAVVRDGQLLTKLREIFTDKAAASPRRIAELQQTIRVHISLHRGNQLLRKMFAKTQKAASLEDTDEQDTLLHELREHSKDITRALEPSVNATNDQLDFIDMGDKDSIKKALGAFRKINFKGGFRTGLQGLNRMFTYPDGNGIPKDTFGCFAAISHNYKSGMLMDMARWMCTYNTPSAPAGTIPTVVFISFENEIYRNQMDWYRRAYETTFNESASKLTDEEIVDYLNEVYSKKGFRLLVFRKIGSGFGFKEYVKLIHELQRSGYYIAGVILDYLGLMSPDNGQETANMIEPMKLQNLARNIRQFGNHSGFLTITGWQLTGLAEELARDGRPYVAKRFGKNHLSGAKGFFDELDWLVFLHKEFNNAGIPYLTLCLGKLRHGIITSESRYCAYRFTPFGIMDDFGGSYKGVADPHAEGDDTPYDKPVDTGVTV